MQHLPLPIALAPLGVEAAGLRSVLLQIDGAHFVRHPQGTVGVAAPVSFSRALAHMGEAAVSRRWVYLADPHPVLFE